ncbi:MAG: diguanylate cyclase, partial [Hydrogenophaga sp.]|nr:diguanylate cyclase [Hydrogenophaga sp.]
MSALPIISPPLARVREKDRDAEWVTTLAAAPEEIKNTVGAIVAAHRADMADEFYAAMLGDPSARRFLDNETVHTRLHASLQRWMDTLFGGTHDQAKVMAALQRQVGEVHARAEIPVQLVSRGMRLLKTRLFDHLVRSSLNRADLVVAVEYISSLMDLAFAEMSSAYVRSHEEGARTDEMFRMITAGQNMALERQRQLAALTDWENSVLRAFVTRADMLNILPLRASAFGLWMQHKGPLLFEEAAELASIAEHIDRLDSTLLPLVAHELEQKTDLTELGLPAVVRELLSTLEESKYLVNVLFDRLTDLEAGRDVLTQLYNRRFLQTIMRRAMKLALRHENSYAVLMLDVDHFKRVNDLHGHDMGDRVLQHVAALMLSHARASDFFF